MRVKAVIGCHELIVLINSGSIHNFVSNRIANIVQLPVQPIEPFNVKKANGGSLTCQGRFEDVPILLQGIPFVLTLYALPLTGLDEVLEIQILEQLGTVACNLRQLTMEFTWGNQSHKLQGIDNRAIGCASMKSVSKDVRHGEMLFAVCLQSPTDSSTQHIDLDIQQLLQNFEDIFQKPKHLPPIREIDHHINLKEGTEAINVRPYMYAYFQKAEIEKQVHDMLKLGLIRPSTSPFSSPVLLVKRKDGTWRFCTNYKALNKMTIKDRYPIPTIDGMLDELHGASYFTKLDLRAGFH